MSNLGLMQFPYYLSNDWQRENFVNELNKLELSKDKPLFVKVSDKKISRSKAINNLSHRWYADVSKQGGEYTPGEVKALAKYKWGVPIMRQHDKFNEHWLRLEKVCLTYEEKMTAMDFLPVTSLMTNAEMSQYMSDFKKVMGQKYQLTDPKFEGITEKIF